MFAQLNQGAAVTSGLKKVKKGEGIADRPIPVPKAPAAPKAAPKVEVAAKPPSFGLNGKKWEVQHQVGNKSIVIADDAEVKHSVYVYKCTDSVISVNAKVNAICLDDCKKATRTLQTAAPPLRGVIPACCARVELGEW